MGKSQFLLLAFVLAVLFSTGSSFLKDWWQTATIYEINTRSFKDSDGDGIGDLNGIIEKLDYLKDIGITATWLSPIFTSPMVDFGYDISNYCEIQPEYGTMEDMDRLLAKAKSLDIKIILDFVPNHSSDEHEWFQKSANRVPGYEDYYIWHAGFPDPKNASNRLAPNNWISVFRGSAWQWNERREEFFLHKFHLKQPDLNFRNPKVEEEMNNVMRFWLDRGVAGFRVGSVDHVYEVKPDLNGNYPNEPRKINHFNPETYHYLHHNNTVDQPENIDLVYRWRQFLDEYEHQHGGETRIMMTEADSSIHILMQYYGNGAQNGAHIPFNFHSVFDSKVLSFSVDFSERISNWMNSLLPGETPNWVIGNHDVSRLASRLPVDWVNMVFMTLPGIAIIYNGDEIGMTDHEMFSWYDTLDPRACNTNNVFYKYLTRDPERTPFQWNAGKNAGFSTANKTWLPVCADYQYVNVDQETQAQNSHLKVFKSLAKLRRERTLMYGQIQYKELSLSIFAVYRQLKGEPSYITLVSLDTIGRNYVNLKELGEEIPDHLVYHIVSANSRNKVGKRVNSSNVVLAPSEAIVLRTETPSQ